MVTASGDGTSAGPDLGRLASLAMPRGLVIAMRMTMTETVQSVTIAGYKTAFPARVAEKKEGAYKIWDLSAVPPVLLTPTVKEVKSIERDQTWKHPPASAGFTSSELADLVGYLRWAATGNEKAVTVEEVGSSQ